MSTLPPSPRPPSRSERLLRDTLRRDDTLRTHAAHSTRPRSVSSDGDGDDEDLFQSAILFRCSSRRSSAASALSHAQPNGFYLPDQHEHTSYSSLLRSSSLSGSSRSGRSDRRSPPRPAYTPEKEDELSCHHGAAPHEAVLRNRLDSVIHSMRIDRDTDPLDSSTASLPSSLGSNSRTHSHESHQTHLTAPDPDSGVALACMRERISPRKHRHTQSAPVSAQPPSPQSTSAPPRVPSQSPRTPRSPPGLHSTPRTQEKEQLKHRHPDSPWLYAPLPPSPPTFSTSPLKCGSPAVVTFVASPVETHTTHLPALSPVRHSPDASCTFDPEAASHALRQLPGYVSFASVAGLGAPPEEEDRRGGRKSFTGFTLGGGKGRLSGLGLGSGRWWTF